MPASPRSHMIRHAAQHPAADALIQHVLKQHKPAQSATRWGRFVTSRHHYALAAALSALMFLPAPIAPSFHAKEQSYLVNTLGEITPQSVDDLEMLSVLGDEDAAQN